ncbi:MAG: Helix-turn-helix domain protein [Bradyrhizobium sp.]|jgi:transcriptional regulator with XRE-family HTH domain|nr:Helix-turn-helix domain protein [Bradyrhizobium sp.]
MRKGISDVRYRQMLAMLISARRNAGLNQAEVARRLGKPQQFVSRYELGERRLDVFEFIDVAETLGLDGFAEIKKLVEQGSAD